jgi:hypothetical protein
MADPHPFRPTAQAPNAAKPVPQWHQPCPFAVPPLGPGAEGSSRDRITTCLRRVAADPSVQAIVLFGSRARSLAREDSDLDLLVIEKQPELDGDERRQVWWRHYQQLWNLPLPLDLVVAGSQEADRLAGSRWHVIGYAREEGKVIHVAQ